MGEKYNKLVRDNIPEMLDAKGIPYEKRIASDADYKIELVKKLQEEVEEFLDDESSEELADVIEVIETLKTLPEYSDIEEVRLQEKKERGGFLGRVILKGEKG